MQLTRETAWHNRKRIADMLRAAAMILEEAPVQDPKLATEDWISAASVCAAGTACLRALINPELMNEEEQTRRMQTTAADLLSV